MDTFGMFVKQPVPGRVKTRLADAIGAEAATRLYAAFVRDLADRFRNAGDRRLLYYEPVGADAHSYFGELAGDAYGLWRQPQGTLGDRLSSFFENQLRSRDDRAVVIGSDSPTLPEDTAATAFELLADHDCVLGPASDGGYYLIGQRRRCLPLFEGVHWSGPGVMQQTAERLEAVEASLALLPVWYDVDTVESLQVLRGHVRALQISGSSIKLEATRAVLSTPSWQPPREWGGLSGGG